MAEEKEIIGWYTSNGAHRPVYAEGSESNAKSSAGTKKKSAVQKPQPKEMPSFHDFRNATQEERDFAKQKTEDLKSAIDAQKKIIFILLRMAKIMLESSMMVTPVHVIHFCYNGN